MMPDTEIVERVRRGDVQAYGALVERYERAVLGTALAVVRNRHAAEDITQEVFIQGYCKLGTLRDGSRFGYWLMKIARRHTRRALRERNRTKLLSIGVTGEPAGVGDDGRVLGDERERLLRHVQQLPVHERLVIGLRFFDGHSVQQIADMTGRPVGTITKRLTRAIERLRQSLQLEAR